MSSDGLETYVHVGAWLLGLQGVALLRSQAGDHVNGEAFVADRFAEIRRILAAIDAGDGEVAEEHWLPDLSVADGYREWSGRYDTEDNPLLVAEIAALGPLLDALPGPATVLDAACGTGRHSERLVAVGHTVIGVDGSTAMLDAARAKLPPETDLRRGDLLALPLDEDSVDHAVCSLALTYLPDLGPPLAELARVVRPGGTIITSDIHVLSLYLGGVSGAVGPDGRWGRMPATRHLPSDYVTAARAAGLEIDGCWEPRWGPVEGEGGPQAQAWCPEASAAAYRDTPAAIVWRFSKPGPTVAP